MLKSLAVAALGCIALLYLVNPGAGIFEIIPDNIPLIGNLDEAAATLLLLNCLAYFGLDLRHLFQRGAGEPRKTRTLNESHPRND